VAWLLGPKPTGHQEGYEPDREPLRWVKAYWASRLGRPGMGTSSAAQGMSGGSARAAASAQTSTGRRRWLARRGARLRCGRCGWRGVASWRALGPTEGARPATQQCFGWSTRTGGRHVKLGTATAELWTIAKHAGRRCQGPTRRREEVGLGWHRWSSGALTEDRDGDLGSGSGKRLPWQSSWCSRARGREVLLGKESIKSL
jgi:hypothetical protein